MDRVDRLIVGIALVAAATTALVGALAAGLFIAAALVLLARNPQQGAQDVLRYSPLLFIPLLAIASTLWSDGPQGTLRAGIQLLLTMMAAIIVYLRAEPRFILLVLFVAFFGLCLTAIPNIPFTLSTGLPLQGPFGSKNALGVTAHLTLVFSLAILLDGKQARTARVAALCSFPYIGAILVLSQSATAIAGTWITLTLFPMLLLFGRIPISGRVALFITAAALLAVGLFFLPDISNAIADFRQNVLKKNATLTGRTYLWEAAARLTAERPLLGHGYYAFWRQGNLEAEGLWRWGGIASRSGFNFHNAFVDMKIDLGLVGQGLLLATCVTFFAAGLFRHLVKPSMPLAFFLALQAVFYIRSYTESGLVSPFSLVTMLWIMAGVCALSGTAIDKSPQQTPTPQRERRGQLPRDPVRA